MSMRLVLLLPSVALSPLRRVTPRPWDNNDEDDDDDDGTADARRGASCSDTGVAMGGSLSCSGGAPPLLAVAVASAGKAVKLTGAPSEGCETGSK